MLPNSAAATERLRESEKRIGRFFRSELAENRFKRFFMQQIKALQSNHKRSNARGDGSLDIHDGSLVGVTINNTSGKKCFLCGGQTASTSCYNLQSCSFH